MPAKGTHLEKPAPPLPDLLSIGLDTAPDELAVVSAVRDMTWTELDQPMVAYGPEVLVPDSLRQRPYVNPARLGAADPDRRILPVNVIKGQSGHFAGPQTVIRQEHQNGKVSLA